MGNWLGDESDWWNKGAGGDEGTSDGYDARFVPRGGVARDVYDTMIEYDGQIKGSSDNIDLLGPSTGDVADTVTHTPGEGGKPWWFKWMSDPTKLFGLIALIVGLSLLGPVLELLSALLGGE